MKIYNGVTGNNGQSLQGGTVIGSTIGYIPKDKRPAGSIAYVFSNPVPVTGGTKYTWQIYKYDYN